jgi:hypothetical protein
MLVTNSIDLSVKNFSFLTNSVADGGMGECVDPEGNGVTMERGAEGGAGPPSGEQDKQLICSGGGGKTSWENQEDSKTGPMRHQELITHRVHNIVKPDRCSCCL